MIWQPNYHLKYKGAVKGKYGAHIRLSYQSVYQKGVGGNAKVEIASAVTVVKANEIQLEKEKTTMKTGIVNEIVAKVSAIVGEDVKVDAREVRKNNGLVLTGVTVMESGKNIAPTIYVDGMIAKFEDGEMTLDEIAQEVVRITKENDGMEVNTQEITSKEYILANVKFQLANAEKNQELIEGGAPYYKLLDLAGFYRCFISSDDNGSASFLVTGEMMKVAGITEEELAEAAMKNIMADEYSIKSMFEVMMEMMGPEAAMMMPGVESEDDVPMFVMTNKNKVQGASVMVRKDMLKALADKVGTDLYILPSSVHEVLAVPAKEDVEVDYLKTMVMEVNATEVAEDEVLSGNVYRYDRENDTLSIA